MANQHRGETPFRALGREMYLVYRTQEIAAMQAALGFGRQDPLAAPTTESVPVLNLRKNDAGELEHVLDVDGRRIAALEDDGRPRMRTVVVDLRERRRRQIEAFDVAMQSPTAGELLTLVRCGLAPYEAKAGKLKPEEWDQLVEELGYVGLGELHQVALANSYRASLPASDGDEEAEAGPPGSADPNAASPAPASQT